MFLKAAKSEARGVGTEAGVSFLGPEAIVTGDIETSGALHLDGKVLGDVRCGILTQSQSGEVKGNILAKEARLAGLVDGAVQAGVLALQHSARITGDILYETLSISSGAEVEGRFKRRKGAGDGSAPAKAAAAKPARTPAPLFAAAPETAEAAE